MTHSKRIFLMAALLLVAGCAKSNRQRLVEFRKNVDTLVKEGKSEKALAILDEAQFRALRAGRFQEDLELSLQIEELS